jgi:hypothetical protein
VRKYIRAIGLPKPEKRLEDKIGSCWRAIFDLAKKNQDWKCFLETLGDALVNFRKPDQGLKLDSKTINRVLAYPPMQYIL